MILFDGEWRRIPHDGTWWKWKFYRRLSKGHFVETAFVKFSDGPLPLRDFLSRRLRRIIVRAAPTCTLWAYGPICYDYYQFRFWPSWRVTGLELMEAG